MILIGLYTQEDGNSWWSSRRTWRSMDMRGTRCLRFRSDPERTCKWTVCLTLDFILCDWYRLHRVVCLCGMLRCKWSRLLLKSKVLWLMIKARPLWRSFVYNVNSRASHLGMSQKRDTDPRSARRFFLAMGGVSDLPALTFIYFSPVWLLDMRRLGYRSVRTGKRVFRNN